MSLGTLYPSLPPSGCHRGRVTVRSSILPLWVSLRGKDVQLFCFNFSTPLVLFLGLPSLDPLSSLNMSLSLSRSLAVPPGEASRRLLTGRVRTLLWWAPTLSWCPLSVSLVRNIDIPRLSSSTAVVGVTFLGYCVPHSPPHGTSHNKILSPF